MDKKFDTFDYEIKRIKYEDGTEFGDALLRCVFIINGKDILDILMENSKTDESFHHTTLADLWAFDLNEASYRPGRIHILICSCDELGCDNINVKVTENKDGVVWNDFRFDDDQELRLSFEFEKNDYKRKIEQLKTLARSSCCNNQKENTK